MEKLVLTIPTLYGDHHTVAVRRILDRIAGVSDLLVSAAYRQVALKFDPAKTNAAAIEKALAAQGYDPGWTTWPTRSSRPSPKRRPATRPASAARAPRWPLLK